MNFPRLALLGLEKAVEKQLTSWQSHTEQAHAVVSILLAQGYAKRSRTGTQAAKAVDRLRILDRLLDEVSTPVESHTIVLNERDDVPGSAVRELRQGDLRAFLFGIA